MSIIRSAYNPSPEGEGSLPIYEVQEMDKRGESIVITMDQTDESGERISHILLEWYGMSNAEANLFSMGIAKAVMGVIDEFRQYKAETQGVMTPPGQTR